jgi:hypothetical protein
MQAAETEWAFRVVCSTVTTPTAIAEEDRSVRRLRPLLLLSLLLVAAVLLPGSGRADNPVLNATVGPGFSIGIKNAAGVAVSRVQPGTYTIHVRDLSDEHSFHLAGPGVDKATDIPGTGDVDWTVTLVDGTYSYKCDAHPTTMRGTLNVGAAPPPTPKLNGRVGPGKSISLKTAAGAAVKTLAAGSYVLTVRDATKFDNFHLLGAGVNRRTGVKFRGTVKWKVTFRAAKTYTVRSDAHRKLRRTFKTTAKLTPPPPPPPIVGSRARVR